MKRAPLVYVACTLVGSACVVALAACSGDDGSEAPAPGRSDATVAPDDAAPEEDAAADLVFSDGAWMFGSSSGSCSSLAPPSAGVFQTAGGAKPSPAGGTPTDGTYVLTKQEVFNSSADGKPHSIAIRIVGNKYEQATALDTGEVATARGTYAVEGTNFDYVEACPSFGGSPQSIPFTATATELTLFSTTLVSTYTKH